MTRTKINIKPLIVILISILTVAVTTYCLRQWNRSHRAELGLRVGTEAYENKQWSTAAQNLGKYIAIVPNDVSALMKYAQAQINIKPMNMATVNQALNSYRNVLRIEPTRKKAVLNLMDIYIDLLDVPAEAELVAVEFLKHRQDSKVRCSLAKAYYLQRKFSQAREELKGVINDNPSEVTAYSTLAQFAQERPEDFSENPKTLYDQAVENNPSNPLAYISRGEYYLNKSNKTEAARNFTKAEQLTLSDISVRLRLAENFFEMSMSDKAREHLKLASKADHDNLEIWQLWAKIAMSNDSSEEMIQVARQGYKNLSAELPLFVPIAAELYIRSDNYEDGEKMIEQVRKTENSAPKVAYLNGLMASRKGDTLKAIKFWRKALDRGLDYEHLELSIASALAGIGDLKSAIIQLRNYTARQDYLPHADLMLAEYLAQTGEYIQAAELANKYLQNFPNSIEAQTILSSLQNMIDSKNGKKSSKFPLKKLQQQFLQKMKNGPVQINQAITVARASIDNRDLDYAAGLIEKLKKRHPSDLDVMLAEIELLVAENQRITALAKLNTLAHKFPNSVKVLRYLTAFHIQKNDFDACEKALSRCQFKTLTPDDVRTVKMLFAEVYEKSQQYDKAWNVLKSIRQTDNSDITVNRWLISIAPHIDRHERIQPLIDKIKDAEGSQGWQWKYEQAKFWLNSDSFAKNYEQIISLLMENLKNYPGDHQSRLLLAAAYEKNGNFQLASSMYKQALLHSPGDIKIILAAVEAMNKAGQYNLAEQVIRNARSTGLADRRLSKLELNSQIRKGDYLTAGSIARELSSEYPDDIQLKLSLAKLNIKNNKLKQAAAVLNELKQAAPDSVPVISALVDLNIHRNNPKQAIANCDELINVFPSSNAYTLRGRTYMRTGKLSKAIQDFQTALDMDPDSISTKTLLARTYKSQGHSKIAEKLITDAVKNAPSDFAAHKTAALIFLASDDSKNAAKTVQEMEKALQIDPSDVEMLILKARVLMARKTDSAYTKAIKILRKATRINPMYPQAWAMLAEINLAKNDYIAAIDNIETGLNHMPRNKMLKLSKARVQASRDPDLALETLVNLRRTYPEDLDVATYLAYMYMNSDRAPEAIEFLRSIKTKPNSPEHQKIETALAEALYAGQKTAESINKIKSLYSLYPHSENVLLAHVRILRSQNQWNELSDAVLEWYRRNDRNSRVPIALLQQILDYNNPASVQCSETILRGIINEDYGNVDALKALGVLLHVTGRPEQALRFYEKVLMIDPERVVAINNMAWILCEEQKKYDQALKLTATGLSKYPDYADLLDTAGVAKYRLGQYQKSIDDFRKSLKLRDNTESASAAVHFHLARSLEKLNRFKEAVQHLQKAVEINKSNGGLSDSQLAEINMLLSEISERD